MILPKSILLAAGSVGIVLLALAVLVRLLENSITFHPTSRLEITPDDYGLDYRDVRLELPAEKITLHGWWFEPADEDKPVLLICHGNAGNISHRLEWLVPILRLGQNPYRLGACLGNKTLIARARLPRFCAASLSRLRGGAAAEAHDHRVQLSLRVDTVRPVNQCSAS